LLAAEDLSPDEAWTPGEIPGSLPLERRLLPGTDCGPFCTVGPLSSLGTRRAGRTSIRTRSVGVDCTAFNASKPLAACSSGPARGSNIVVQTTVAHPQDGWAASVRRKWPDQTALRRRFSQWSCGPWKSDGPACSWGHKIGSLLDLTWIKDTSQQTPTPMNDSGELFVLPEPEQMESLRDLAKAGNMRAISEKG
jgi:hypothetical protein